MHYLKHFFIYTAKLNKRVIQVLLAVMILSYVLSACQSQATNNNMVSQSINTQVLSEFEQQVAQRMSLDIRYYCADIDGKPSVKTSLHCRTPVTKLPNELAKLISETSVGGIVLFAENVQQTAQVVQLTHNIQQAAIQSKKGKPLIISMDQEGGRVARFAKMTGFPGNMAIGATLPEHGDAFAVQVNAIIAKELKVLGINNNYAPVVDVNTNAENPVINTRSFGESAEDVSTLGVSAVNAIQAQKVMATLKHFPGHGDTHVDSHLGLPRVDHDRSTIDAIDLAPFKKAIKHSNPAMVMTAHIQYPALDDTRFMSKSGESLVRPATMSRKILTGLLRDEMAFKGIIATDALDMAGITQFFTDVEAVVETFVAGADLAVMPFKVRTPDDITAFYQFIKKVAQVLSTRIEQGDYQLVEFERSIARLDDYKEQYIDIANESVLKQVELAEKVVANAAHLQTEQMLANAAVTVLKNGNPLKDEKLSNNKLIPVVSNKVKTIHLVVANQQELNALTYALSQSVQAISEGHIKLSYFIADDATLNRSNDKTYINADLVLTTLDIKTASLVDLGGMDDLTPSYGTAQQQEQKLTYANILKQQLILATKNNTPSIVIAKGSPFLIKEYAELSDAVVLNFDDRIYENKQQQLISPGFNASIAVIFGLLDATGKLPVTTL